MWIWCLLKLNGVVILRDGVYFLLVIYFEKFDIIIDDYFNENGYVYIFYVEVFVYLDLV